MYQLDSFNSVIDNLTVQVPIVLMRTHPGSTLSTFSHSIILPTADVEPVDRTPPDYQHPEQQTKSPIQPVHLDVQSNETVPVNSHHHTNQLSPYSGPSFPVLHLDVETQSQVYVVTVTKNEPTDLIDCERASFIRSSPFKLDIHIDDSGHFVQSPTPAQSSDTPQSITHNVRDMPSQRPFRLTKSRSRKHPILNAARQHHLDLKYVHSRVLIVDQMINDHALHITINLNPAAYRPLSRVT